MSAQVPIKAPDQLTHRLNYRPELDGLRALAVLAVVFFHAGWSRGHGGFLGVDVFFTLSGYLITTLLLTEYFDTGTITLRAFWLRRAVRLMPAQLVMAFIVVVAAWLSTPPGYFGNLASDALSAIFYVGNWHLIGHKASYFAAGAPPSLFTHSWSLAIEEQFYLVWPVLTWLLLRRTRRTATVGVVAFVGAIASWGLTQLLLDSATSNRLYYGTDTHAIGILAGAALAAWVWRATPSPVVARALQGSAILGALALGAAMYLARGTSSWVFQYGFVLVAIATCLVIYGTSISRTHPVTRALSWRPLTYLGRISYGVYLWHYPVIALINHHNSGLSDTALLLARILVTGMVASASYHFVELPLRRSLASTRRKLRYLAAALLLVVVTTLTGWRAQSIPTYELPTHTAMSDPVRSLMLGDSVALTVDHVTAPWRSHHNVFSSSAAVLGCGIGPSFRPISHGRIIFGNAKCHLRADGSWPLETIWRETITTQGPDVVVVGAGRWETHDHLIGHDVHSINDPWFTDQMRRGLTDIWESSRQVGAAVILLTTPCTNSGETKSGHSWSEDAAQRRDRYNEFVRVFATTHTGVSVLDVNSWLCPGGKFSYFDPSGKFMIRNPDGVHAGPGMGPLFGDRFWSVVRHVGESSPAWHDRHEELSN